MTSTPGFTGNTLDRADRVRHEPALLEAALVDVEARLLVLDGLDPVLDETGRLTWTNLSEARGELLFIGYESGGPRFASAYPEDEPIPLGRSPAMFALLDRFAAPDAANYAAARSLIFWHGRHRFCANCGSPTRISHAGWARHCPNCGAEHFPRVEPVVIMIAEHEGKALMGRQPSWPPGRYSALAGFLELGESIEEAVRRETFEEAGIRLGAIRYVASQPWPFPSSLMVACIGEALNPDIRIDTNELEDARWFTRNEVALALARDPAAPFLAPPPYAIAHTLLSAWAAGA